MNIIEFLIKLFLTNKKPAYKEELHPMSDKDIILTKLTPEVLKKNLFKFTPLSNIQENLPLIYKELEKRNLLTKDMVIYSLATLYVENDKFKPISEIPSKWSTKNGQKPYDFSNYIGKMGNKTLEDASLYRGSGLIQLTLKGNYELYDKLLGLQGKLIKEGYKLGNDPAIAAKVFAEYLKQNEQAIKKALLTKDYFKDDRQVVNGPKALHWEKYKDAHLILERVLAS